MTMARRSPYTMLFKVNMPYSQPITIVDRILHRLTTICT